MEKVVLLDSTMEKPQTLRERIVSFVKAAVISGKLKPGERVPEQDIAETLGISRTPIREAFRQLETEGFISITPRKGAVVAPITDKEVREFYAIKSLLEGYAARIACGKLKKSDIQKLEKQVKDMTRFAGKSDVAMFLKTVNDFHDTVVEVCANEKLFSMVHGLVQQFERFRVMALKAPGRMKNSLDQHEEILDAFKKRDEGLAEKLIRANSEQSIDYLIKELAKEKEINGTD